MKVFKEGETELINLFSSQPELERLLREKEQIHLSELTIPVFPLGPDYKTIHIFLNDQQEREEKIMHIYEKIEPLDILFAKNNIPLQMNISVCEAIMNAYMHANREHNPLKPVRVHYAEGKEHIHVLIEDQAGVVKTQFIRYLIHQRRMHLGVTTNFYEHTDTEKPEGRGGCGTFAMHQWSDVIGYHMSAENGLLVSMKYLKKTH